MASISLNMHRECSENILVLPGCVSMCPHTLFEVMHVPQTRVHTPHARTSPHMPLDTLTRMCSPLLSRPHPSFASVVELFGSVTLRIADTKLKNSKFTPSWRYYGIILFGYGAYSFAVRKLQKASCNASLLLLLLVVLQTNRYAWRH